MAGVRGVLTKTGRGDEAAAASRLGFAAAATVFGVSGSTWVQRLRGAHPRNDRIALIIVEEGRETVLVPAYPNQPFTGAKTKSRV